MIPLLLAAIVSTRSQPVICIDPGHPSEVGRGTHGRRWSEIHMNWVIAKLVERELEDDGFNVVLTKKSENEFVTNRERAEIANKVHAGLFLRLHCDGGRSRGYAVYYPASEGHIGSARGPSEAIREESRAAAEAIHHSLKTFLADSLKDDGLKPDSATRVGSAHGALVGSIYSHVPVVLVEMATLTSRRDERFLASAKGQKAMSHALAEGAKAAVAKS